MIPRYTEAEYEAVLAKHGMGGGQVVRRHVEGVQNAGSIPAHPAKPYRSKTEARSAEQLLLEQRAGLIKDYKYEAVKLKLAPDTMLTLDWLVVMHDNSIQFREVKGKWFREDGWIKLKVAAALYPWWPIYLWKWDQGQWELRELPT